MKKYFYVILMLVIFFGQDSVFGAVPKMSVLAHPSAARAGDEPPFISRDTVETFLAVAKALESNDSAKVITLISESPEILDATIFLDSLLKLMLADPQASVNQRRPGQRAQMVSNRPKSEELYYFLFLKMENGFGASSEHHILDLAAKFGTPEIVEFLFQKFLERQKVPMPRYVIIEKCLDASKSGLEKALTCASASAGAANPVAVAAAQGRLKIVKVIVEFVRRYYRERGLPIPNSFFNSGFIGGLRVGNLPALAETTAQTYGITSQIQQGGLVPVIKQNGQKVTVHYVVAGPLLLALNYGHEDVAQYLLNEGALDDMPRNLKYGLLPGDGYLPIAFYLDYAAEHLPDGSPARKGYTVDLAKYAQEERLSIPVSTSAIERLSRAVKNNDFAKVKKLVAANKDLPLRRDKEGMLPIEWAGNKLEIAKFLKEHGSEVPDTLLFYAFGSGSLPVAQWLIGELKFDPKKQLARLVEVARVNGQPQMLEYLASLGLSA